MRPSLIDIVAGGRTAGTSDFHRNGLRPPLGSTHWRTVGHEISCHDHAGGRVEIDADATAVCRKDQCGALGDGEGGGRERPYAAVAWVSDITLPTTLSGPVGPRQSTNMALDVAYRS